MIHPRRRLFTRRRSCLARAAGALIDFAISLALVGSLSFTAGALLTRFGLL